VASEGATLSDQRAEEGWASLLVRRRCRSSRRLCGTPATAWFGCKGPPRQHSRRRPEAWLCGHWPTSTLRRSRQTGAYGDVVRLSAATCWLWSCRFSVLVITGPSRSGAYLPDRRPLRGQTPGGWHRGTGLRLDRPRVPALASGYRTNLLYESHAASGSPCSRASAEPCRRALRRIFGHKG
jgi:hypothetical protein